MGYFGANLFLRRRCGTLNKGFDFHRADAVWRALSTLIRRRALAAIRFAQTAEGRVLQWTSRAKSRISGSFRLRAGRDAVLLPNGNLGYNGGSHPHTANLYPGVGSLAAAGYSDAG